jgi:hypothetical protein
VRVGVGVGGVGGGGGGGEKEKVKRESRVRCHHTAQVSREQSQVNCNLQGRTEKREY